MRYPEFIKKNDTIGFPAPSLAPTISPYKELFGGTLSYLNGKGYKTLLGKSASFSHGVGISGTPEECGKDLTEMYLSDNNDALISCGGGELMCETLGYVDFESIRKAKPKWYMGYSDNTNFVYPLVTMCDVAAIYGPCACEFGARELHESAVDALSVLEGKIHSVHGYPLWEKEGLRTDDPLAPRNLTEKSCVKAYKPVGNKLCADTVSVSDVTSPAAVTCGFCETNEVTFSGRLLGGCLDCLVNLCGTRFDKTKDFIEKYKEDGFVWFLESCDLNLMSIRRAVWELKEAGWFKYVKGFLIGRPLCFDEESFGITRKEAYLENLREFNVPVVLDADIGHYSPMMPLVVGCIAKASYKNEKLGIEFEYK